MCKYIYQQVDWAKIAKCSQDTALRDIIPLYITR